MQQQNCASSGGSNLGSTLEDDQSVLVGSLRNMVKKEVQLMALHTLPQMIKSMMKELLLKREFQLILLNGLLPLIRSMLVDFFRTVVKEEVQAALANLSFGGNGTNTDAVNVPNERSLRLKFLDEEPDDVLTGMEIKGKGGNQITVALVDGVTGDVVESGVESSAKVEILLLESSEDDDEQSWGCRDFFNSRIIKESEKLKPHFPKSYHVYLKKGVGELTNTKLAHDKNWKKSCTRRLGARAVSLNGVHVQEAWTKPFAISDKRGKLYNKKCYPPSPVDEVWRLDHIGKNGAPHKRLEEIKVDNVKDFLILLSVDPQRLRNTLGTGVGASAWKAIVAHAQTCRIDDAKICVYKNASSECDMSVVFNVIEGLKGVIRGCSYTLVDDLSELEKKQAQEFLRSAFDNKDAIKFHNDEMALVEQLSDDLSFAASRRISCDSTPSEIITHHDPTQPAGTSSLIISPSVGSSGNPNDASGGCSLGLTTPLSSNTNGFSHVENLADHFSEPDILSDFNMHDFVSVLQLIEVDVSNLSETPGAGDDHHRQSQNRGHVGGVRFFGAAKCILWRFRAKKRVLSSRQGDVHISKKQKI